MTKKNALTLYPWAPTSPEGAVSPAGWEEAGTSFWPEQTSAWIPALVIRIITFCLNTHPALPRPHWECCRVLGNLVCSSSRGILMDLRSVPHPEVRRFLFQTDSQAWAPQMWDHDKEVGFQLPAPKRKKYIFHWAPCLFLWTPLSLNTLCLFHSSLPFTKKPFVCLLDWVR